jgi:allophanate hydrolase subunit 1
VSVGVSVRVSVRVASRVVTQAIKQEQSAAERIRKQEQTALEKLRRAQEKAGIQQAKREEKRVQAELRRQSGGGGPRKRQRDDEGLVVEFRRTADLAFSMTTVSGRASGTRKRKPKTELVILSAEMQAVEKALLKLAKLEVCEIFAEAVDLAVFTDYLDFVDHPMDLGTMLEKLRAGEYADPYAMKLDFDLIEDNCKVYNDDGAEIAEVATLAMSMAYGAVKAAFFGKAAAAAPKKKGAAASTPASGSKAKSKKKGGAAGLSAEMQAVEKAVQKLVRLQVCEWFSAPVDLAVFTDYLDFVEQPMDLHTVLEKLRAGEYADADAMKPDFALIVKNCRVYNDDGAEINEVCQKAMATANDAVQAAFAGKGGASGKKRKAPAGASPAGAGGKAKQKQKRKKVELSKELQAVERATKKLLKEEINEIFAAPVDLMMFSDYLDYVEQPMDLRTMLEKLQAGEYADADAMKPDFDLIELNCRTYNDDGADIAEVATEAMAMCYEAVKAAYSPPS